MHEASLVQGLLDIVLAAVRDYNASHPEKAAGPIREIVCGAGLLAGFEEQTLKACFEIFSENTLAEGASLVIETMPLACSCETCGHRFELRKRHFICPVCASEDISFKGGNGLVLQAINVNCEEEEKEEEGKEND